MHRVIWYQFRAKRSCDDSFFQAYVILPNNDGALLLRQILSMPKAGKTKMDFAVAMNWCMHEFFRLAEDPTSTRDVCSSFKLNMIQALSEQGYYLELTGQEFCVIQDEKRLGAA